MSEELDTHRRALAVNLDAGIYGVFAEIGAGQEVARWFFQVGGAAGTVAKTISAYDMTFSDAIYGKGGRYVSRDRVVAMLEHEYRLLLERLSAERAAKTRFFVFADTVSARNYAGTNECHGWLGLRFQTASNSPPSDIILHVNMMEPSNLLQQQALGVLGVNLVYSAFFEPLRPEQLLKSLFTDLSLQRLEIDVVELSGPAFASVDLREVGLLLVRNGYANGVLFHAGRLTQPSDILRKKPIIFERGFFRTEDAINGDMMVAAAKQMVTESGSLEREPLPLFEISVRPVRGDVPADPELLRSVDQINALGMPVVVTRLIESYRLTEYLRRYTKEPMRFAGGASTIVEIFQASNAKLIGGMLEALGRMLADNIRFYVFPMPAATFNQRLADVGLDAKGFSTDGDGPVTAGRIRIPAPLGHLYSYLLESGWVVPVEAASR
jgi:hypothetical protein